MYKEIFQIKRQCITEYIEKEAKDRNRQFKKRNLRWPIMV
jgi:hypothetical protein